MKQFPTPERPVVFNPFPRCLQSSDITLHTAKGQLGQLRQLLRGNTGVLADERENFQPVDQLLAVLMRFLLLLCAVSNRYLSLSAIASKES